MKSTDSVLAWRCFLPEFGAFLLGFAWTYWATWVAADWYHVINAILLYSVRSIDDQPAWARTVQNAVACSPILGVARLLRWGTRKHRWAPAALFLSGVGSAYALMFVQFWIAMGDFD